MPIITALRPTLLALLKLPIVAPFSSTLLTLLKLPIIAALCASFLSTFATAIIAVAAELTTGHAAFAAHAVVIGADITTAVTALDARLAIAFLAGIVASILNAVLRRELRSPLSISECNRRERARREGDGSDAGCQF
ncbi:MAG: hypothetical protein AAFW68_13305 [Pseudomonadota bacterium]